MWPVASYVSESWNGHWKQQTKRDLRLLKWQRIVEWWKSAVHNKGRTSLFWMNSLRVTVFWQLFSAVSWSISAMLSELKTFLQIYCIVASMVWDLEADRNSAGQMMWRTRLVYRFRSAFRRLEAEQQGDPSCCHHWASIFRNEEEPTTTTTTTSVKLRAGISLALVLIVLFSLVALLLYWLLFFIDFNLAFLT